MKRGPSSTSKTAKKAREDPEEAENEEPSEHQLKMENETLKKVTVFEDRAELKREFSIELSPGLNEVIIERVSDSLIDDSVRVSGKGDAVIEEVKVTDRRVIEGAGDSERAEKIRAEKSQLERERKQLENEKKSLEKRIEALDKMIGQVGTGIVSSNTKFSADPKKFENVTNLFDFYDNQVTELREKFTICDDSYWAKHAEIRVKEAELRDIDHGETLKVISVLLDSTKGGKVDLELTYQVSDASWYPFYDVRVDTKGEKNEMKLSYYANVSQNTGEDWEGAQLTLSTARPSLGGKIPELGTLDAVFYKPPPPPPTRKQVEDRYRASARGAKLDLDDVEVSDSDADDCDASPPPPMREREATVSKQTLYTEFEIARPCSIPAREGEHKVTIGTIHLEPQLVHVSVPSKCTSAFLTASCINGSSFPLLEGEASVYLDGAFVAKSEIKSVSPMERFTTSLGVDPAVKIDYKPAHRYHEHSGLRNKTSTTVTVQKIVVRNTREDDVLLTVREQIPRSTDEKIKIKMISPTAIDKVSEDYEQRENQMPKEGIRLLPSNNLEWTVKMEQGKSQTLLLKYQVEHPSTKKIEFVERN